MKQLKKIAAFAAIALLAGISCAKENNIPEDPSVPSVEPTSLVFTASTEHALSKTTLSGNDADGYSVQWMNGDEITIVDGAAHVGVYSTTSTTTSGTFTFNSGTEVSTADFTASPRAAAASS